MVEVTVRDIEIIKLNEKIERLEAIIDLYISPLEEIFSEDDQLRASARRAVTRRIERNREVLDSITDIREDVTEHGERINALEAMPRPNPTSSKVHERKMKRVDQILISHNNQPISFADMGKLLGYSKETRKQNMTHLAKIFKQFPDRYEVRDSKLGGKTVRLVPAYLNHILKDRG